MSEQSKDSVDRKTFTITLTEANRRNLVNLLRRGTAKTNPQARAIHDLRDRLGVDVERDRLRQYPDGMVELMEDDDPISPKQVDFSVGELSVIKYFFDLLEDRDAVPTAGPYIDILDKFEPKIDEMREDGTDESTEQVNAE